MSNLFLRYPNFVRKAVTLSYDDGVLADKKLISVMKKNGLKGTFNINSSSILGGNKNCVSKDEAKDLYLGNGYEIACHGERHLALAEMPKAIMVQDVINDRRRLEDYFDVIIQGMAYAEGSYSDDAVEVLQNCGINYSRTCDITEDFELPKDWLRLKPTCHHNNPRLMELAKKFVENQPHPYFWANSLKLFYMWGHSYEFDNNQNWNVIEQFAEYIGNRNDIWYATNGEIYDYVHAYERLITSTNGHILHNPTDIDLYVNYFENNVMIPAGKTIKI